MRYCENCGTVIPDGATVCPNCKTGVVEITNTPIESALVNSAMKLAIIGLVVGVAACFIPGSSLPFAIISLVKSGKARKLGAVGKKLNVSMILAIAAIVAPIMIYISYIIYYVIVLALSKTGSLYS
jgi:hypothetical protein